MKALKPFSAKQAGQFLRDFYPVVPDAAVVLGSGVRVLEDLDELKSVSFQDVFGISPGVVGHSGTISIGKVKTKVVAVFRGRFHLYEGHDWDTVTLPTRAVVEWGVPRLFLTNAAGGLDQRFKVGDLMVLRAVRDHLNPKFKDSGLLPALKSSAIDCLNALAKELLEAGSRLASQDHCFRPLQSGTYVGLLGPNYETLAEIDMLKALGCDAVGMSTVPELITAYGTRTIAAAVSVITNVWSPDEAIGGHEEVLEAAKEASIRLDRLFREVLTVS